jgi:nitrite reductase/ring-hydroxylating ferredoxin subunit
VSSEPWRSERTPPPPGTDVCALKDVADGKSRVVPFGARWPGVEVIVVREGERVYGYINECAHMAVPLNLLDDFAVETNKYRILCDHHYAAFRFSDGYCLEGPCQGESLTAVPLAVRAGRVVIVAPSAPK